MDLLKKLEEDAAGGAVGGGAIGGFAMPLLSSRSKQKVKKNKVKKFRLGLREVFTRITEDADTAHPHFDQTEVVSKLKALEKKDKIDRQNATTFGLEDEDGKLVRVTVQADQADEFENALAAHLAKEEEEEGQAPEIPEVLFRLRDRFNILDVAWPEVEEDQEEGQAIAGQPGAEGAPPEGGAPGAEGAPDMGAPGGEGGEGQLDLGAPEGGAPDEGGDEKSLLIQVIDMMKADADARRAEAMAKQKEAEARQEEARQRSSRAKVKQEEEMLDMEDHFKRKNEMKKETKQLAKLAQWKRETGDEQPAAVEDKEIDFGMKKTEEEEEVGRKLLKMKGRVPPSHLAAFLLKRVK